MVARIFRPKIRSDNESEWSDRLIRSVAEDIRRLYHPDESHFVREEPIDITRVARRTVDWNNLLLNTEVFCQFIFRVNDELLKTNLELVPIRGVLFEIVVSKPSR
jgi:hypothetical protein